MLFFIFYIGVLSHFTWQLILYRTLRDLETLHLFWLWVKQEKALSLETLYKH